MAELDHMEIYRRLSRRPQKTEPLELPVITTPGRGYYEFRTVKERPVGGGLKYITLKLPHQMPPGFPFRDIPTDLIVADAPMIHSLRRFGMLYMVHHVPLAREYFGNLCSKGLRPWGRS